MISKLVSVFLSAGALGATVAVCVTGTGETRWWWWWRGGGMQRWLAWGGRRHAFQRRGGGMRFGGGGFGGRAFPGQGIPPGSRFPVFVGFASRDHRFFRHDRFHRFAFIGAPYYYDDCWRRAWTPDGLQWINACGYF